jgi:hypothetical protein
MHGLSTIVLMDTRFPRTDNGLCVVDATVVILGSPHYRLWLQAHEIMWDTGRKLHLELGREDQSIKQ